MIQYDTESSTWYNTLTEVDTSRMQPILDLYDECVPDARAGYYKPNILILKVGDQPALALSPRKQYISFYTWSMQSMSIFRAALPRLGKVNPGVGCLRFRKLQDIDMNTLREVFTAIAQTEHESGFGFQ